jgi:hypothetical protein
MSRYLISFDQGAMDHIPDEEGPAVGEAAHAVSKEAMDAGVFVFAGGFTEGVSVVDTDGTVTDAPKSKPHIGGGMIVDVPPARTRCSGLQRSPSPAAVLRSATRSCLTRRWATERSPTRLVHAHGSRTEHSPGAQRK